MNIGFSQDKQMNKNQRRSLMNQDGETGLLNRPKSRLIVIKPRNKASFLKTSPKVLIQPEVISKTENILEEVIPEPITAIDTPKEAAIEKETSESIPQRYSNIDTTTIQIGFLNLREIENFGDISKNNDLPEWQYTAFDPQTGGAWIGYSYGVDWGKQKDFLKSLSEHFESKKILSEQIDFEVYYDSSVLNKLRQADTEKSEEYLNQYFPGQIIVKSVLSNHDSSLNRFHYLIEDNFYNSINVRSISKLVKKAESFLIQYNYKENYEPVLNLPPNQMICRQYGNKYGPKVLKLKPIVIKKNQTEKARYLIGLNMMVGLFTSITGSVLSRKDKSKRIKKTGSTKLSQRSNSTKTEINESSLQKSPVKSTVKASQQTKQVVKPVDTNFEYISLKNMNWEKPKDKRVETKMTTRGVRNRQELISKAKELLAQKRSIAELKKTLPMSEGELSMISQNIRFSDKERNTQ